MTDDTKRVTVVVTICANATLLPLVLVFKGQPKGRIVKKEFPSGIYPEGHFYHYRFVRMDGRNGNDRMGQNGVETVRLDGSGARCLGLDPGHVPICHMMASVVQMIQEIGVKMYVSLPACQCWL